MIFKDVFRKLLNSANLLAKDWIVVWVFSTQLAFFNSTQWNKSEWIWKSGYKNPLRQITFHSPVQ